MAMATEKACDIVTIGVAKGTHSRAAVAASRSQVNKDVLVIGGGVAGIQAALDLADAGLKVTIVERETTIGGTMASSTRPSPPSTARRAS